MPSIASNPDQASVDADPQGAGKSRGKAYWRSLERLLESPAVQEELQRVGAATPQAEFPAGASDAPQGVSRRSMLTLMGASFALAGLEGCRRPVETIIPYVDAPENIIPGIPRHYATTMPFGTSAYGVVVENHEGRPTKIEGNEMHPSSLGGANAWMQGSILALYDPDRSSGVRQRTAAGSAEGDEAAAGADANAHGDDGHAADEDHGGEAAGPSGTASSWQDFESFWGQRASELEAAAGAGLAVLSTPHTSPTEARLAAAVRQRFPSARWVTYAPVAEDNVFNGCQMATGTRCRPVHHMQRAKVILSLESDFLGLEQESLRDARQFARGRQVDSNGGEMSRLYVAESSLSATGAVADHRLRSKSFQVGALAAAVAGALGVEAADYGALPDAAAAKAKLIADDLRLAGSAALVVVGRRQPATVHALALAINQALGAVGTTVTLHPVADTAFSDPQGLTDLAAAMGAGDVSTLVILGGNPAYDAPVELGFAAAMSNVEHSIHLSDAFDETSQLASWHLPASHYLETWGDVRAADGTLSVVQPLIAPLWDSRSQIEVLALMAAAEGSGYDQVRQTWQGVVEGDFEKGWRRVLHDGVLVDSASPPLAVGTVQAAARPTLPTGEGLELTFHPSATAFDGRFANLSWLQELPDSLTKITWDNAVLLSPATAEAFGLKRDDRVSLGYRDHTLEAAVFVLPGQADESIALSLGYGRRAAGRVGDGLGFDAYTLRHGDAPWFDRGVSLTKVDGDYELVQTQEHWSMEGRDLVHEVDLANFQQGKIDVGKKYLPENSHQLFPEPVSYEEGPQWGMTIDLNSCIGCNACMVACQSENNVPVVGKEQVSRGREMHWLRVDRYFSGQPEDPEVVFQPIPCMHCENAPCEQVCPVAATVHDRNGINAMVYNRCIGTRYCSNNCPYKVRRFNFFNYTKDTPELLKMAMNPDVTVRSRGVMEKCSYCLQRINEARIFAKRAGDPGAERDVKTACQQTCPTEAIAFGDIRDANSQVSQWKSRQRDFVLLGELNNRPRTSYLAKVRNPNPAWGGKAAADGPPTGHGEPSHGAGDHAATEHG